jgi:CheY-like chemotaxis protein
MTDDTIKMNVLYVDDDRVNLRVLADMLGACGITVTCALGGAEALELLAVQAFDVVLMDLHMPGLTGVETLARLRENAGLNQQTPVVAVTADVGFEQDHTAMGFDGFLAKPVSMKPLLAAVLGALHVRSGMTRLRRLRSGAGVS